MRGDLANNREIKNFNKSANAELVALWRSDKYAFFTNSKKSLCVIIPTRTLNHASAMTHNPGIDKREVSDIRHQYPNNLRVLVKFIWLL